MDNQVHQTSDRKSQEICSFEVNARFKPNSFNEEARTAQVVFGSDTPVHMKVGGQTVLESLSFEEKSVRLGRLNDGAPLLDNHTRTGPVMDSLLGVVERAWVDGKNGYASIRFAKSERGTQAMEQVRDGMIRNVSVGYAVYKYDVQNGKKASDFDLYRAIDWEPQEISLVSVPADPSAKIRSIDPQTEVVNSSPDQDIINQRSAQVRAILAQYPNK